MTRSTSDTMNRRLERTPRLEAALAVLRTGLVRRVLLHGLGTVAVVGVVWLLFAFLADWGLRVPKFVRVFHGLAFVGLVGGFAWHALVRPWRRVPGREGLAILFERAKPELRQLLVSAVQFQEPRDARAGGDPELIERVLAAADDEAGDLDPGRVLDDRGPRRRVFAGVAALAVGALLGASQPTLTGIFFARLLGRGVPWPQRTTLTVLIPLVQSRDAGGATVVPSDGRIDVRIARGTDVPILVRADGVVPDEVVVNFDGGRDLFLATSSGGVFRTLLRSCQEDVRFWVTGGDDNDGLPRVHVHVLEPPDVEGLAIEVQPPDYSDLEPARYYDRDVEVLAGSRLRIAIRPSTPEVNGVARILPDDRVIALEPVTFPL